MFADLGHGIFSADNAVHELYKSEAINEVKHLFPQSVVKGEVDRNALAEVLIEQPEKLAALEAIIHPLVRQKFKTALAQAKINNIALLVVDIPLLYEGKNSYDLDAVAVTFCDDEEQYKRAMARPDMTKEKLTTILKRQLPQLEKRRRADFGIDTNQTITQTRAQVVEIASQCVANVIDTSHTN